MRTKKTTLTIETLQLLVVRRGRLLEEDWCTQCCQQVRMVTADEAAVLAAVSLREICQGVEANTLHFKETGDGLLFICLNSLMQRIGPGGKDDSRDQRADNQHS